MVNFRRGKYVVFGGSGLIGTSVLSLLKDKDGIDVVSTYFQNTPKVLAKNIYHVQKDLRGCSCDDILYGADYVILLASNIVLPSLSEKEIINKNTDNLVITSRVLESCYQAKIKRVVWASSTTGFPDKNGKLKEEEMFVGDPIDKYFYLGWVNRFMEKVCLFYANKIKHKMRISIIRPTCVYGENEGFNSDKCHMLPTMVKKIIDGEHITIWGNGEKIVDLIHADDVAEICVLLLDSSNDFQVFNIGTGKYYSVNDIIDIICKLENINDLSIDRVETEKLDSSRLFSVEKMEKEIKFTPRIGIDSGIKRLISEYKKHHG